MRLYILDNGYLEVPKSSMLKEGGDETIKMPINLFLIDTGKEWVLFDTGCPPDAMNGYWPKSLIKEWPYVHNHHQLLENQLLLCGITPKDINTVVLSHFHLDHTGNLHLFKHADVYAPKEDFLFALCRVHSTRDENAHGGYIKEDMEVPVKQYHLIEKDTELFPGIELITLPGHAVGLLGMVIHLEESVVILPQDSVYAAEIYGPPAVMCSSSFNNNDFYNSIEKVRSLEKKYNAKVIFGHDENQFKQLKHAPEYYEKNV